MEQELNRRIVRNRKEWAEASTQKRIDEMKNKTFISINTIEENLMIVAKINGAGVEDNLKIIADNLGFLKGQIDEV